MDIDIDTILTQSTSILKNGTLSAALEYVMPYEKQARNNANLDHATKLLEHIITLCRESDNWTELNHQLSLLSKKRAQLKQAVTNMIRKAMSFLDEPLDMSIKLSLIDNLRQITAGKIFVEVERARLTKLLSSIKENQGNKEEATNLLFELPIETFASLELGEKLDYLLDQMRLAFETQDYTRLQLVSRKITMKFFQSPDMESREINYYEMMIHLMLHDKKFLECARYYMRLFEKKSLEDKHLAFLGNALIYTLLAPYDNEQSDLMNRIYKMKMLDSLPLLKSVLKNFIEKEIMRWPIFCQMYERDLKAFPVFSTNAAVDLWLELKTRVLEHNVRIISQYYMRIRFSRLISLLDVKAESIEDTIAQLVISKTIYARIDRPAGLVNFSERKSPDSILEDWSTQLSGILKDVVKVNHLIAKEEMLSTMKQQA